MSEHEVEKRRIMCPVCGYMMPVFIAPDAEARGVYIPCKGRKCKNLIEIKVKKGWQKV